MKFKLDVSKGSSICHAGHPRCMPMMPYSTALYFTKVQEILTDEMNKELR